MWWQTSSTIDPRATLGHGLGLGNWGSQREKGPRMEKMEANGRTENNKEKPSLVWTFAKSDLCGASLPSLQGCKPLALIF